MHKTPIVCPLWRQRELRNGNGNQDVEKILSPTSDVRKSHQCDATMANAVLQKHEGLKIHSLSVELPCIIESTRGTPAISGTQRVQDSDCCWRKRNIRSSDVT
jgi:hypothetical protein